MPRAPGQGEKIKHTLKCPYMNRKRFILAVSGFLLLAAAFALILVPTPRDPPNDPLPLEDPLPRDPPPDPPEPEPAPHPADEPPQEKQTKRLPGDTAEEAEPEYYVYRDGELKPVDAESLHARTERRAQPAESPDEEATRPFPSRLTDPEYRARRVEELRRRNQEAYERAKAWAERTGSPMRIETNDTVMILVDYTEELGPLYRTTLNVNAAVSTATDLVIDAPYHLSGAGITAGIWDGGNVRATHTEFVSDRVTNFDSSGLSDHATHVAGTMIARGADASARGMATNASLYAYDFDDDLTDMTSRAMADPEDPDGTIQISNHSYGFVAGWEGGSWSGNSGPHWFGTWNGQESDFFGQYIWYDEEIDQLVYDALYYLPVQSAGNDRNDAAPANGTTFYYRNRFGSWVSATYDSSTHPLDDFQKGGYDTIPFGGVAKNMLLVGAVNDAVTNGVRDLDKATMSTFSGWGPTDDGRIKPDIVANGVGLTSSGASSDTHYYSSSGTSMSAPNASGSAILLLEQYGNTFPGEYMLASTIKALIIHTADSLDEPGPDYRNGWGLMNTRVAVDHITAHADAPTAGFMMEDVLNDGGTIEYEVYWDSENDLWATLVWTDPPGTPVGGLNNTTPMLVNDLDLRVITPSGTTNYPWILDPSNPANAATTGDNFRDNVEQVYIAEPEEAGYYTIRISHKGSLTDDEQVFSLMVSGIVATDTLRLEGDLDFGDVQIDTEPQRVMTIHNDGDIAVTVTNIALPPGFSGSWTGSIAAARSRDVTITFSPTNLSAYGTELTVFTSEPDTENTHPLSGNGVDTLALVITEPEEDISVAYSNEFYMVSGTAGAGLSGQLTWENLDAEADGLVNAQASWSIEDIPLAVGTNVITVTGTNNPTDTVVAEDSASGSGWETGDNTGSGFNAWILETTGTNAGHFIATTNEHTNLDINSPAWGLWANSGDDARALRPFGQPLRSGDTFRVTLENNWVANEGSVGVALLNPDGEYLFEFYFAGGEDYYRINDSAAGFTTTLPYTDTGVELALTRTGEDTYDLTANEMTLKSRTFAGRSNMEITRFRAFNHSAGAGSDYDFFFNDLSIERAAADPVMVSDQVVITRSGPPPDTPELFVGLVEDTYFEAYWTAPSGATGYVFDVHTDESFVSSTIGTGGFEDFSGTGDPNATYRTIIWTNEGIVWSAYNARNSDTMTGTALTLNSGGGYLISSLIDEHLDQLSLDHRKFTGQPGGSIAIYINTTNLIGTADLANSVNTALFSDLGIDGPFTITVTNTGARPAGIDNLTWTNAAVEVGAFVPGYSNLMTSATNILVEGLEAGSEYFLRVKAVNENGESDYTATNTTTLGQARKTQTITFDPIEGDIVTTNVVELSASASSGLPVSFHVESGPATITNENQVVFSMSGGVTITATQEGDEEYQPAPPVSRSFFVNKAIPSILTPPEASDLTWGQSLAESSLTGGVANTDGVFDWLDDSIVPPGGISTQAVVFLPEDTNLYANADTETEVTALFASLEIDPVDEQMIALDPSAATNLIYTLTNSGNIDLDWSVELLSHDFFDDMEQGTNGWTVGGDNALWSISTNRSTSGDHAWYSGYTTMMWSRVVTPPIRLHTNAPSLVFQHWIDAEIIPDSGTAWHGGLVAISRNGVNFFLLEPDGGYPYSLAGTSLEVYSGSNDWSSAAFDLSDDAGEWVWLAFYFITDNIYSGIEEGWYIDNVAVSPREAGDDWIQLSPMSNTIPAESSGILTAAISAPAYLAGASRQAVFSVESNDDADPIQTRSIKLQVNKNPADISLENLTQFYDGTPKVPTAITDPAGLNVVFTYDGSPTPPVEVDDYTVVATIDDLTWAGATTGTLSIVELRGAIDVEDSIPPVDDRDMPFGDVFLNQERIEQITIHNTNQVDELTVLDVFIGGGGAMEELSVYSPASARGAAPSPRALRQAALESDVPRSPDTLLVRFAPKAESTAARNAVHTLMGTERRHRYRTIPVEVVELPPGADLAETIAAYEARPDVEYAEPNFLYAPMNTPNDPSFNVLWGLHNTGQSGGTPGADISALQAWAATTGSTNVIVAVIDTGIDYNHPDLAGNMWVNPNPDPEFNDIHGARWTDGDGSMTSGDPMDGQSHGTHVAGTIGAVGNNALGVVGVNWQVRLMALKFLPDVGNGSLADAIAAIEYAIEHGAHLSNNSWGGGGYSQALKDVIDAAGAANQLFVAAAGNDNNNNDTNPSYPATYDLPNIISVANSTRTDARRSTSNYGLNSVHLAAPGTEIYSTVLNGSYGYKSGTSMAAPHVAGTAALLLSLHPNTAYANLKDWILGSVTPLSNWENLVITGGRLNAAQAIATSLENGFSIAQQPALPFIIPPGESVTLDIRFRPPAVDTYTNILTIVHNDLDQPDIIFSLSGTGLSVPPTASILTAAQTSIDGSGTVTIEVDVEDPDSPSVDMEVLFSTDNGATWSNAWIASAGTATITNEVTPQVLGIDTGTGSNQVAIAWSTTNQPAILLSTSTLVRVRAWDGYTWSEPADSVPFLVDNEPPTVPTGLASGTHTVDAWSTLNAFDAEWLAAEDGDGIGVAGYGVSLEVGQTEPPSSVTTTGLTHTATDLADGTNWWLGVQAMDAFGNISEAAYLGPFRIDATPPDAESAVVEIESSPFGNYTFSAALTNTWSGFTDAMSGIAGYYLALADGSGTTNGLWTTVTSGVLDDAALDQTNTVYVWARDIAGNIGDAASAEIIVLSKEGDWDGTGMSNWQKEIAGLDATDPTQIFKAKGEAEDPETDELVLRWPFAEGRVYTIDWSESRLGTNMVWHTLDHLAFSITNGWVVWTDTNALAGADAHRFYRIQVELEE